MAKKMCDLSCKHEIWFIDNLNGDKGYKYIVTEDFQFLKVKGILKDLYHNAWLTISKVIPDSFSESALKYAE